VTLWALSGAVGLAGGRALLIAGAVGYVGGGPTIHALHHQHGRTAGSVALRLGLPLVGGAVGAAVVSPSISGDSEIPYRLAGGVLGAGIGMIAASLTDIAALAWAPGQVTLSKPSVTWMLVPGVTVGRDANGRQLPVFGLSGVF